MLMMPLRRRYAALRATRALRFDVLLDAATPDIRHTPPCQPPR